MCKPLWLLALPTASPVRFQCLPLAPQALPVYQSTLRIMKLVACMSQMRYAKIRNTNIPVNYEQLGAICAMIRVPKNKS